MRTYKKEKLFWQEEGIDLFRKTKNLAFILKCVGLVFQEFKKGIVSNSAHSLVMFLIGLRNVERGNYTSTYM